MTKEYIYLYTPRSYSPGYAYRRFEDALAHLLKDSHVNSLEELAKELDDDNWWYKFGDDYVSVDDGGRIEEIELR